jgi:16S rRNA processing protein RimM
MKPPRPRPTVAANQRRSGAELKPPELIRIGYVRRAVGLSGEVEVEPLTDDPARFRSGLSVRTGATVRRVEKVRGRAPTVVLKFVDVNDRSLAERLRGQYLEVDASEAKGLPEGSYYHWQLVGLEVFDIAGRSLGKLTDVLNYPANDIYVVSDGTDEVLVPALAEVVTSVDLEAGRMVVDLPEEEVVE